MSNSRKIFAAICLGLLVGIGSCTDTIEIVPDPADALLVVDAWLDDQEDDQTIRLTRSQTYFDATKNPAVEGAVVEVLDDKGNIFSFADVGGGDYVWSQQDSLVTLGRPGTRYSLTIDIGDKTYTSTSTMQPVPPIDEIRQEFRDDEIGREDGIWIEFIARDLPGDGNTYWIKSFKNDSFLNKPEEINLAYDASFDAGSSIDGFIFIPPIREAINPIPDPGGDTDLDPAPWAPGDRARVEIHSVNHSAFNFVEVMRDQILNGNNGIFATPLANTRGNVTSSSGETVLGVFNVASVSSLETEIIIQN